MPVVYTAVVVSSGDGRKGVVASDDGAFELRLAAPKEVGGSGAGSNPEQLFAAGYSACFHSALKLVAKADDIDTTDSEVSATVSLGMLDTGGFGIAVELDVHTPALEHDVAEALVAKAHEVCPYSNATRGNVDVQLTVV